MSTPQGSYFVIGGVTGGAAIHGTVRSLAKQFERPANVLYIGAAGLNDPGYEDLFARSFPGEEDMIRIGTLQLYKEDFMGDGEEDPEVIRKNFEQADIVFFDGGDIRVLREVFEKFKLKDICKEAFERGACVGGLCIGGSYLGAEVLYRDNDDKKLHVAEGLNLIKDTALTCYIGRPQQEERLLKLQDIVNEERKIGVGVPVNQTMVWNNSSSGYGTIFGSALDTVVYMPD